MTSHRLASDDWSSLVRPPPLLERHMPAYRLYYLNPKGGIRRAVELACETDEDAIALVDQHIDGHAMELWDRDRVVRTFPAAPSHVGAPSDPQD